MHRTFIALSVAVGLSGCAGTPRSSAERDLADLCDEYWEHQMRTGPTWATVLGDRRFDDRLPRIDAPSRARDEESLRRFLRRVKSIDRSGLPPGDLVTAEVLEHQLVRTLDGFGHKFYQWDIDQMFGPQVWFFELVNTHPMDDEGRRTFLARLDAFPAYLDDYRANLREGLREGNLSPNVAVARVTRQVKAILDTPAENCPLLQAVEKAPEKSRKSFRDELLRRIRTGLYPAYGKLHRFLKDEYRGRDEVGVGWNEAGLKAYASRIRYHTSLPLTARELHETGLRVLVGLRERMTSIARKLGHEGDLRSFNRKLRQDKSLFYGSRKEVFDAARAELDRANGQLPKLFGRLPKIPCIVKEIERYRERDATAAYYNSPSADGSRPGTYYINTYKPEDRPRYNMPALSLHEAVPGHHLQIAIANELTGLPKFRRHLGVTAFVEGWALYSELLGEEVGLYDDDLEIYGMLTYQAWRASRLVVDTGMHAFGWNREQAIRFFRDNVAISETNLQNEIDRYIIWPGQALAYMVGRLKIQELRREAERALGDRFDLRAFHDEVLRNGAVPLPVLENVVRRWIRRQA